MKPEELKIGNYWTNGHEIYIADASTIYDLESAPEEVQNNYKGVPLTEQWLLDFLFVYEKIEVHEVFTIKGCDFSISKDFCLCVSDSSGYNFIHIGEALEFVHELQNLYRVLTKKELTLKIEL